MKNNLLCGYGRTNSTAFTLVELAIVLVIIGLIIGGVLVGQELISQYKMRSQATQFSNIDTAALVFKEKYRDLPGDISDTKITNFGFTPLVTAYNARGNGQFDNAGSDTTAIACHPDHGITISGDVLGEAQYFFIHLHDAGLYPSKQLTPLTGGVMTISEHLPTAKIGGGLLISTQCADSKPVYIIGYKDTAMADGSIGVGLGRCTNRVDNLDTLSSEWAALYDKKFDDGLPLTGGVRSVYGYSPYPRLNDGSATDCSTATAYNVLTNDNNDCSLAITGRF